MKKTFVIFLGLLITASVSLGYVRYDAFKKFDILEDDLIRPIETTQIKLEKHHSFSVFLIFYPGSSVSLDSRFSKSRVYKMNNPERFLNYINKNNAFMSSEMISTPMEHIYFEIDGKLSYGFGVMFDGRNNPFGRFSGVGCMPATDPIELSRLIFDSTPVFSPRINFRSPSPN